MITGDVVCSYNGILFSALTRSHATATPIPDSSGRVTKFIEHKIEIESWLSNNEQGVGDDLEDMQMRLTQPSGELKYMEAGYGDLHVNGTSKVTDCDWGPKPSILSFKPLGGGNGAFITWAVTTRVPMCNDARYQGIRELNYTVSWDIDENGVTTRTISGHIEIALNRSKGEPRVVKGSAEQYREKVRPDVPLGFQRMGGGKFTLSEDRTRLEFIFVDKQIVRPLPGFATGADVDQEVTQSSGRGGLAFFNWDVTLSGTITLPPDRPRSEAWDTFLIILRSRLSKVAFTKGQLEAKVTGTKQGEAFLRSIRWSEKIFGWTSSFDVRYQFIGVTLDEILLASGLWQPIAGTSFAQWKKNLDNTAWNVRGTAGLRHRDGDEILIDLCSPTNVVMPKVQGSLVLLPPEPLPPKSGIGKPKPEFTWKFYENKLRVIEDDRVVRHKRLPVTKQDTLQFFVSVDPATSPAPTFAKVVDTPDLPANRSPLPDSIQILGPPSYLIEMIGEAERIEFDIPIPRLKSVNGVDVTQVTGTIEKGVVGSIGPYPIHGARWHFVYIIASKFDGEMPDLANPVYQTPGG